MAGVTFSSSDGPSLGVEVELVVVDAETRRPVNCASGVLEAMANGSADGHPKAKHELFESTVEVITGICGSPSEAVSDLGATIDELATQVDRRGGRLISAGTHPFSLPEDHDVSPDPRYAELIAAMGWVGRRLQIFGMHVHVGIRSGEKAIAIANAVSAYIPHFLALSSSSPYWQGEDTGMASYRSKVFENLPTAGLPEQLDDWGDFERFLTTFVAAGAIGTVREVWWDIRPHPEFGTIELRMCDGISTLAEVGAVAGLAQTLVHHFDRRLDAGDDLGRPVRWVLRQNKWRAARHGLAADLIVDAESGACAPLRDEVDRLADLLAPRAAELATETELERVVAMAHDGSSSDRQRDVVSGGGSMLDVVDHLADRLLT